MTKTKEELKEVCGGDIDINPCLLKVFSANLKVQHMWISEE